MTGNYEHSTNETDASDRLAEEMVGLCYYATTSVSTPNWFRVVIVARVTVPIA